VNKKTILIVAGAAVAGYFIWTRVLKKSGPATAPAGGGD